MFALFRAGGPVFMSILTLLLVLLFVAAWKAPAWVKELGKMAPVVGIFSMLLGFNQMFSYIIDATDSVPFPVICGGMKVALIPMLYGLIIYFISLIIRITQKPRI